MYEKPKLVEYIKSTPFKPGMDASFTPAELDKYLKGACDSCMPRGCYRGGKKPAYWWTTEISELRDECKKARRNYKEVATEEQRHRNKSARPTKWQKRR